MTEFKPGDVVSLKSGGMPMTISYLYNGKFGCQWHNKEGMPCKDDYLPEMLMAFAGTPGGWYLSLGT